MDTKEIKKKEENLESLYTNTYRTKMPLYSDYVFHRVFGSDTEESNAALIGLLNIVLDRDQDPITKIKIKNPIDFGNFPGDKPTELDIKAETSADQIIDIEMQVANLSFFRNRTTFYAGRLVNSSLKEGENYDMMKQSVVVSIVNGRLFPEDIGYHGVFELREKNSGVRLSDRLVMHFLQLSELDLHKPVAEMSHLERLGFYLRYANDASYKDQISEICNKEERIIMTEDFYRKLSQEEIEAERAEAHFKYQLQYDSDMYWSKKVGHEEGLEEGKAIEQREIAKNFKDAGFPHDIIAQNTGLSLSEIEEL